MLAATTPAVIRPQERAQQDDKHYTKTAFLKDPDMSMAALAFMQGVFVVMHQVGREICVYPPSLSSTLPYPPGFFSISFPLPPPSRPTFYLAVKGRLAAMQACFRI